MLAIRPVCWGQHVSTQLHLHCHASGKASGTARDSLFTSRSDLSWAQGSSSAFISPMSDNNSNTLREVHALSSSWRHEHVSTCSLQMRMCEIDDVRFKQKLPSDARLLLSTE